MSAIFLSHSSADNEPADTLRRWLEGQGYRSFFLDFDPEQGIPAGRDWEKELYAQLRAENGGKLPRDLVDKQGRPRRH